MGNLTVATLNINNRHNNWLKRRELIVAEMLDEMPDLISLQEIYRPIGQGRWIQNQVNSRISGSSKSPYQLVQCRRRQFALGYSEGLGILSRLPILSHDFVNVGYGGRVALRANIELPARDTLDFVSVHLHPGAAERQARLEQCQILTGWMNNNHPSQMQIIAGDFNETPDGPAIDLLKQTYRSAFETYHGYEPLATYPTAIGKNNDGWSGCLDYIFMSKTVIKVNQARLICNKPSPDDHELVCRN